MIGSIQGVIKFVGHDNRFPQPLRPEEVNRLLGIADTAAEEAPKDEIPFLIAIVAVLAVTTEGVFG